MRSVSMCRRHGNRHGGGQSPAGHAEHRLRSSRWLYGVLDLSSGVLVLQPGARLTCCARKAGTIRWARPAFRSASMTCMPIDETALHPGDTLFLFATGSPRLSIRRQGIGTVRLEAALEGGRGGSAAELVDGVLGATASAADADQSDDITCLALVFRAGARKPLASIARQSAPCYPSCGTATAARGWRWNLRTSRRAMS